MISKVCFVMLHALRYHELIHSGLSLHTMIEIAPTAREVAAQLDAERKNGTLRSPLHGVPIVVKDSM